MDFGTCVRDSSGGFVSAITGHWSGCVELLVVKTLVLRHLLKWLRRHFNGPKVVEVDFQEVLYGLRSTFDNRSQFGSILADCSSLGLWFIFLMLMFKFGVLFLFQHKLKGVFLGTGRSFLRRMVLASLGGHRLDEMVFARQSGRDSFLATLREQSSRDSLI